MICAEFSLMNWRQLLERLSAGSMNTKHQKWAEVSTWATKAAASAWRESLHWGVLHAARVGKSCHELHGGARGLQKKSRKLLYPKPLYFNTKEKLEGCLSETSAIHIQDGNGENHSVRAETFKREQEGNYSTPTHPYLTSHIHVLTQVLISVQIL